MRIWKIACLLGGFSLVSAAQAQLDGVIDGLNGVVTGVSAPLLGTLGVNGNGGRGGLTSGLQNGIPVLGGSGNLGAVLTNNAPLTGLNGGSAAGGSSLGTQLAGDLPAGFNVSIESLKPFVRDAILNDGVIALPAGILPPDTMVPVSGLEGLDPALEEYVVNGFIAARYLPEDLPVWSSSLDPSVIAQVLESGVPAVLLPELMMVVVTRLPNL